MRSLISPLAGCEVLRGHPQHVRQELLRVTRAGGDRTRGMADRCSLKFWERMRPSREVF